MQTTTYMIQVVANDTLWDTTYTVHAEDESHACQALALELGIVGWGYEVVESPVVADDAWDEYTGVREAPNAEAWFFIREVR